MKVIIPNGNIIRRKSAPYKIGVEYSPEFEQPVKVLLAKAAEKGTTQLRFELSLPHRRRSTGPRSQNGRIHGNCQDIADQLCDYTMEQIKDAMKRMAVSEGYPTVYGLDGKEEAKPSRYATIEEAKIILDIIQRFADEHGLYLTEYDEEGTYKTVGGRTREEMKWYKNDSD